MPLSHSARLLYYRCTLVMAWVAMCLLFAGPLISQFQASHQGHHHSHHAHQAHDSSRDHGAHSDPHSGHAEHHHQARLATLQDTAMGLPPFNALSDWHNQCGYCELWQHSPSLTIALPAIASEAFVVLGGVFLAPQAGALFQHNYPHALTRGPPSFNVGYIKQPARAVLIVARKDKKETGLLGFFKA
ncbi:DUF2946 domain-containing protein [Vreelandella populi]|uniref:DUF2946 domain-containing protein n=1 Tax=Vreelandella populi TaxID=2498858 RepID=A0A433LD47_9GAMM|nr:DUF2946 domain-containing protein [Halomonas populi]RUR39501.1 DUF2946 domain-containing protein [Halomonas populi]RUR46614.1 DUF2946 domain-containing protein [Halomonas populi]RUR52884.1 DUF2946 domain-containing protein [Halomonas populi]